MQRTANPWTPVQFRPWPPSAGWQLVSTSDVNNNPMDDKDYDKRVWRLPPTLRYLALEGWPEVDDAQRAKSLAIGESDRFTLLFVKPTG